jgi:hypothetical protein
MNQSQIKFNSISEFYTLKKKLFDEMMEIATKLTLYINDIHNFNECMFNVLIQNDGTCSSFAHASDDIHAALMRYTKNNIKLADELTNNFVLNIDTCLLAFFLISPYHAQLNLQMELNTLVHVNGNLRISSTEMLMMLLRQVVLKMTCFDGRQYLAFSLAFQFTPIRFCNPTVIVNKQNTIVDSQVELTGPLGCNHFINGNHDLVEPLDDIISEVPTWHLQEMFLSFAMATHDRLGADSHVQKLHPDILALIGNLTVEIF